jgi:hypothetical protein
MLSTPAIARLDLPRLPGSLPEPTRWRLFRKANKADQHDDFAPPEENLNEWSATDD